MKKLLGLLVAVVAIAFGLITLAKWRTSEGLRTDAGPAAAEKERIKTFWAAYNRASTFRIQSDFARAVPAYREALQINPQHEDSLYYLGTSQEELGAFGEAIETFRRLLDVNPASGRALGELGKTLSLLAPDAPGDFQQARQALMRNLEVNREQAGPFLRLGMLDLDQGRADLALQNFRIAAGFGSPEGNFSVGYALYLEHKYRESVPYFRKVLEAYGRDRKIIGKGVLSEGDLLPSPDKPLTPLERAGLKSILFLYWTSSHLGAYPPGIPAEFQVHPHVTPHRESGAATALPERRHPAPGHGALNPSLKSIAGRATWISVGEGSALPQATPNAPPGFRGNGSALPQAPVAPLSARLDAGREQRLVVAGLGQPLKAYRREGEKLLDITDAAGLAGVSDVWDVYSVDYDADGYPDLYLIRSGYMGAGQNLLYHNNRDGTFSDVTLAMGLNGVRSTARACFFDFDGDGRVDLLEIGAGDERHSPVRLYRNLGRRFVEVTREAGLSVSGTAVDCTVSDYDRDGRPDVFVLYWKQPAVLYRNLGNGKLRDVTEAAGLGMIRGESFSALFFDYDRDGRPDLLVTAHAPYEDVVRCLLQPEFHATRAAPRLFHNQSDGKFREVTEQVGLNRAYGTMQAVATDLDGDGWPDLLLVNGSLDNQRLEPSVVLRNLEGKEFREWFYLPSFDSPGNFLGAALADVHSRGRGGLRPPACGREQIYLASHPLFGDRPHRPLP
jgi:Tfp pilus assembly protein PilF